MKKVILIVQDGWGIAPKTKGNYISQARTPNFNKYTKKYPHCKNKASGEAVGLPKGSQGNSEVGHLHMGAGRIVWQVYEKINRAIRNKKFFKNKALTQAIRHAKKNDTTLHLLGMCSDEGVHSHTDHLMALLKMAKQKGQKKVQVHFIADGRDVPEKSAKKYAKTIERKTKQIGIGKIGSLCGRYYAMDRDKNWNRTKKAYDMLTTGKGFKAKNIFEAIDNAYKRGDKTDYYIRPTTMPGFQPIKDRDSIIFFNFRTDRPRQLTKAFIEKNFNKFKRQKKPKALFTTMSEYHDSFTCPEAFKEDTITNNLGKTLSKKGLKQIRIAETEKAGHVTYFFNSETDKPYKGEKNILIPSPKVPSYDQKPEMSANKVAQAAIKKIKKQEFDFMLINFANCDLVGHSAVKKAIIKCVEFVDKCTEKVVKEALKNGYEIIVTADHGSAEDKLYKNGKPKPAHSKNPVNFILVSKDPRLMKAKLKNGGQKDVAPTILDLMGIKKPKQMTGKSLILKR